MRFAGRGDERHPTRLDAWQSRFTYLWQDSLSQDLALEETRATQRAAREKEIGVKERKGKGLLLPPLLSQKPP